MRYQLDSLTNGTSAWNVKDSRVMREALALMGLGCAWLGIPSSTKAASIFVPNHSFESPDVVFAAGFNLEGNNPAPWQFTQFVDNQIGAFDNQPPTELDYIDNVDGNQVAFMFVGPGVSLFQDLTSPDAVFTLGQVFTLTVAAGGSPSLPDNAQLQLRIYYRDDSNEKVTVVQANFDFDPDLNPGYITHLFDYSVTTPVIQATDPWLGKPIGIEISTPGDPAFAYWDVDNVRVDVVPEPASAMWLGAALVLGWRARRPRTAAAVQA